MTAFGEGWLPDFNVLLTADAMVANKATYQAALDAHRGGTLGAICDAMGLLQGVRDSPRAVEILDEIEEPAPTLFMDVLQEALNQRPPKGMFVVYIDAQQATSAEPVDGVLNREPFTAWQADWPRDPLVVVIRGPHP